MTIGEREPTADERKGMDWWNSLSEPRRAEWLRIAGSARAADAWAEYKRYHHLDGADDHVVQ